MGNVLKLYLITFVFLFTGCTGPITKERLAHIKTVGIWNTFPEYPHITNIGTTVFNNKHNDVPDPSYKLLVTDTLKDLLTNNGYEIIEYASKPPSESYNDIDVLLEVSPGSIYNLPYTSGYGFYQRSVLGVNVNSISYAALHITHTFSSSEVMKYGHYHSVQSDLPIDELPDIWDSLSDLQKVELKKLLKEDIHEAVLKVFSETNL